MVFLLEVAFMISTWLTFLQQCLSELKSIDLFNCEVTNVEGYREKVFEQIKGLQFLDGYDRNNMEAEEEDDEDGEDVDGEDDDDEDGDEEGSDSGTSWHAAVDGTNTQGWLQFLTRSPSVWSCTGITSLCHHIVSWLKSMA